MVGGGRRGQFSRDYRCVGAMRPTQHLAESQVKRAETGLGVITVPTAMSDPAVIGRVRRLPGNRIKPRTRVPCRVYKRALLRDKQQDHAHIMK